jgi:hypothetical protein
MKLTFSSFGERTFETGVLAGRSTLLLVGSPLVFLRSVD